MAYPLLENPPFPVGIHAIESVLRGVIDGLLLARLHADGATRLVILHDMAASIIGGHRSYGSADSRSGGINKIAAVHLGVPTASVSESVSLSDDSFRRFWAHQ